ncbi:DNA polymerase III subunit alpha [Acidithiobacillus sp.]|jgi:DNA polymerase-3 subunit alpha|uniref:DNA polymerase III subunit alpha n=1 Tax=Acidithiobacillus sp. TaxID=1872118 RepID=UPI0025C4395C|nr:DNA polymerase III subunit alpha [Acidithiobacillus sp.]MCK9188886.1 DNA polymerase III subunit alpha [Acidithiobacillus sp.]MCK9358329.1 DNA polymerase III subunit alpha [Acidithiobacillus sp.]
MSTPQFIHLHVHSEYSLEDGIIPVKALARRCAERGMPAVAITDHGNLFALVKFYNAVRGQGVKPVIGSEIWVHDAAEPEQPAGLILLCMNKTGYGNLSRLLSRAYLEGARHGRPQIDAAWLEGASDGLIALSAAGQGEIGRALQRNPQQAEGRAQHYARLFPERFYLEVQRNGEAGQEALVQATVALAEKLELPLVATNNAHFLDAADFAAFDARQCISAGFTLDDPRRPRRFTPEHRLPDPAEMRERFADLPEACDNTVEIARRCNMELVLGHYALPDYPIPAGQSVDEYLHDAAQKGLQERLQELRISGDATLLYHERLLREVGVIQQMGFPGYFLIVADFIQWAKNNGVPVGPGRGSGAGSLVAYALRITDLDPIGNGLLFERFLNPERVSMPDFDVDFCMDQRDRVIQYVADKYGRDRVGQIITFGTMKARAVVRDVGRVLGLPYGFVDQLAKLVPGDLGMTLAKALEESEELRRRQTEEDDVRDLLDIALRLEGLPRHASTHAGGVVISPDPLADRLPLFNDGSEGGGNVTQLDKDDVEKMGLVKFDFLGLRTLTIIDMAVKLINADAAAVGRAPVNIQQLPLDDAATFALLKSTETAAVFQLESSGMRDLVRRLQPDTFEDIVALVALFRPGPLQSGMVDDFIARKHGKAPVIFLHPDLAPILDETYGVIVYQEQVMQSAQALAGYSLGGADLLRRAMGKKKPEEMAKQRSIFLEGAHKNGLAADQAGAIFDLMEKFAEYGFNKSHSAAYALVSYQTAYLKAHYPQFFMAAVLSADMDHTDKVVAMIAECARMGLRIAPPSIQRSVLEFRPEGESDIRFGLGAIKGLGRAAIQAILDARREGPFLSLFDLLCRVDGQKINRRALEALIRAGAMDDWSVSRASLIASVDSGVEAAAQFQNSQVSLQESLFSGQEALPVAPPLVSAEVWSLTETLRQERETLGFYLSGHPMDSLRDDLAALGTVPLGDIRSGTTVLVAGLVVARRSTRTKRGDRIYFLTLDDGRGRLEVVVFAEVWARAGKVGEGEEPVLVLGEVGEDSYSGGLRLNALRVLGTVQAREELATQLTLELDVATDVAPQDLLVVLRKYPGQTALRLRLRVGDDIVAQLRVTESLSFAAKPAAIAALAALAPTARWRWDYRSVTLLVNNVTPLERTRPAARRPV